MVTARATGERVEDLSQRTEESRVYAQPNGTWTSETAPEPVQVQDEAGVWHDIDTTLVERDGGLAPRYAVTDIVFSDGGDRTFAAISEAGKDLGWKWPDILPEPVVEGDTATYEDVVPGGDLVVTATATGFTHSAVLHERPTEPLELTMPLLLDGTTMSEDPNGSLAIETANGRTLAESPAPLMWDSSEDVAGEPEKVSIVDAAVGQSSTGQPTLTLAPDEAFLTDPDTVYPVVVDPSFTTYSNGDAWVMNKGYTSAQIGSEELRAGSYDNGEHKARSFMRFGSTKWNGKHVTSATLRLRNFDSASCASGAIRASMIDATPWKIGDITWGNQPQVVADMYDDYAPAHGANNCDAAFADFDLTEVVDAWAHGTVNNGIRLKAVDETSSNTWRRYRSTNYHVTESFRPKLLVTYNSYPHKPGAPTVAPGNTGYSTAATTELSATVSDPDAGQVAGKFSILNGAGVEIWTDTSAMTSSGGVAEITVPLGVLTDGASYTARVKGTDGSLDSTAWSPTTPFTVDTTAPEAPAVTASAFTAGQWTTAAPPSNTFSLDGGADVGTLTYSKDGGARQTLGADGSGDAQLAWVPANGWHTLAVKAVDKAGNTSLESTFTFGVGGVAMSAPADTSRSTNTFPFALSGPAGASTATLQWRVQGKPDWSSMTGVRTSGGAAWSGSVTSSSSSSTVTGLLWDATSQPVPGEAPGATLQSPALLEVRGCLTYPSGGQNCSPVRTVQLVPSGFGGNMPATSVGPASVALTTGEFSLAEGDAADAATGVGRAFASFDSATLTEGVFGPGWSSLIVDIMADAASATLLDQRGSNGAGPFQLIHPDGSTTAFQASATAGEYLPIEEEDTRRLTFTDNPTGPDTVRLYEDFGSTTVWDNATGEWLLTRVVGPGDTGTTSYERDANNRLVWLAQDAPAGVTCTASAQQPGCRGLKISYTGTGSFTRVSQVAQIAYDPLPGADGLPGAGAGMTTTPVATYSYTNGLLTQVCDPRPAPDLCTGYSYTAVAGRTLLATLTPPGQAGWRFGYDAEGRLATVKRVVDPATGTGDATWTVTYDVDLATSGLPDLTPSAAAQWGQSTLPKTAAAVFYPGHVPAGTPSNSDWPHASMWYFTEDGTTTNTAVHGDNRWLIDTTWYDDHGSVVQTLDGVGRARALAEPDPARRPTTAWEASWLTVYDADGSRVVDEYGPAHTATLENGTSGLFRPHTSHVYDDDPAGVGLDPNRPALPEGETSFGLVVEERHSVVTADLVSDHDTRLARHEYSPNVTGDGNGWTLGTPTRTKVQTDSGWSTSVNRFDTKGRTVETRQPGGGAAANGSGNDTHSTTYAYYTADSSAPDPECRNKPQWEGLTCRIGPAAQPLSGPTMPTTYAVGYTRDQQPTRVEDRSSATTRVTRTDYDPAGRPVAGSVIVTGGDPADSAQPPSTTTYHEGTGLPETISAGGQTITTTYDTWGRVKTYTDVTGLTSTTSYTRAGQVATHDDGAGSYTYGYDGSGEHRGLPTSVNVGLATGSDTFTLDYDAAGAVREVTYPNGLTATWGYDQTGSPVSLDYHTAAGGDLLGFTATNGAAGRVLGYSSPASTQTFTFDKLGRLTKVEDARAEGCTTRNYGFSASSERTSYATYAPNSGGGCQTATATVSKSSSYDAANRITNAGYAYDNLGRTRTTPAADTAPGAAGPLTSTYHPSDMVDTLTQTVDNGAGGTVTQAIDYALDPQGRISSLTATTGNTETQRIRYRFANPSDSPSVVDTSTNGGTSWQPTRYLQLPGLGMVGSVTNGNLTYQLANLHGDIVGTQANTTPDTIDSYSESDEYGNQLTGTAQRYGWLGRHQRAADAPAGLVLMGARVYNSNTGAFLSEDPILDGNATRYGYPEDPIGSSDTTGMAGEWEACRNYANPLRCATLGGLVYGVRYHSPGWHRNHNYQNAGRHFAIMVMAAILIGVDGARAIGRAHEIGATNRKDSARDKKNNRYTLRWYGRHSADAKDAVGHWRTHGDMKMLFWHGVYLFRIGRMYGVCSYNVFGGGKYRYVKRGPCL